LGCESVIESCWAVLGRESKSEMRDVGRKVSEKAD